MQKWPDIPYARWQETGESLHMWLQIVGKFRLSQTPWMNHAWQATFYVTTRGLSTGLIPGRFQNYSVDFDFIAHQLIVQDTAGAQARLELHPMSVADFHKAFVALLNQIGAPTIFHGAPNEVEDAKPFYKRTQPGAYNPDAAHDFWRALVAIENVFHVFRTSFLGKSSPVHLFWGSLDLAVTRFSGRSAPLHPGGIPNLPDPVTREAYSHEVSSAGFWPGGNGVDYPAFYSYAYPTPEGFKDFPLAQQHAYFDETLSEFILPYDAVRSSSDPEAELLGFLQTTYRAAAETGEWDSKALECDPGEPGVPRAVR